MKACQAGRGGQEQGPDPHSVSRPCSPSRRCLLRSPSTSVVTVSLLCPSRTVTAFVTGVALSPLTARLVHACLCDKSSASLSSVHSQSAPHSFLWNLVFCQTLHSVHFARMRSKDTGGVAPSNLRWGPNSAPDTKALPFSAHHILGQSLSCFYRPSDALGVPTFKSQSSF